MEREERGYFAYRKFGGRLVIVLHLFREGAEGRKNEMAEAQR